MRISEYFQLDKSQHELDFVDIKLNRDTPLFVDPFFLGRRNDPWSIDATRTIRSFFSTFIELVRSGKITEAKALFLHLHEPNETRLGLSVGKPSGRGVGSDDAARIFDSLSQSRAIKTGLLEHLEDCKIFVDGIDKDKTSDMTTNIIRSHLIDYTNGQCRLVGIPLTPDVATQDFWDRQTSSWQSGYREGLVINGARILLVPKGVVSYTINHTPQKYYQHFVLNFLQQQHLRLDSALVQKHYDKKTGKETRRFVTKKSLKEKAETKYSKDFLATFTGRNPKVFEDFRTQTKPTSLPPQSFEAPEISAVAEHLISKLKKIRPGGSTASEYHRLIVGILELLFYPDLICPQIESEIHEGRKRIDITFDNAGSDRGFFHRLQHTFQIPCPYIHVECKNYTSDIANPELDQLSSRFAPNRGKFGLLLCRTIQDMSLFLKRCNDTYRDGRGVILPMVDEDLNALLKEVANGGSQGLEKLLTDRQRSVCLK